MYEIEKEEWDKVFKDDNEDFENDFNKLIEKYIHNKEEEINKQGFLTRLRSISRFGLVKEQLTKENWLVDMRVYGQLYMPLNVLILNKYNYATYLLEEVRND